jgi:hypothetical protein
MMAVSRFLWAVWLSSILIVLCASGGCQQRQADRTEIRNSAPVNLFRDGYNISAYPTAEEQLRYARGWFSDPQEKRLALQVILEQYPKSRVILGQAELELAYLALGRDYRLADPAACRQALESYARVINRYEDIPSICAKAYWYMGWILTELLQEKRSGMDKYWVVVDRYPDEIMRLEPAPPWVRLVLPKVQSREREVYEQPAYYWRSIALLEIIRTSDSFEERRNAFQILWLHDPSSLATGFALLELLCSTPAMAGELSEHAWSYLESGNPTRSLAEDIRKSLERAISN